MRASPMVYLCPFCDKFLEIGLIVKTRPDPVKRRTVICDVSTDEVSLQSAISHVRSHGGPDGGIPVQAEAA